jgi:hypothetical protein
MKLIPKPELLRVKALLQRVCRARGFSGRDRAAVERAWASVLAAAIASPEAAWTLSFQPQNIKLEHMQRLLVLLDATFLGGVLVAARPADSAQPPLRVVMASDPRDPLSWLSGLHDDNTIYVNVNSPRWREDVAPDNPLLFEGALCGSRLEVLLHTLGHELVGPPRLLTLE